MNAAMRVLSLITMVASAALLAGCEKPPVDSVQTGYRGTGMLQVYNPRTVAEQTPLNQPPAAMDAGAILGYRPILGYRQQRKRLWPPMVSASNSFE